MALQPDLPQFKGYFEIHYSPEHKILHSEVEKDTHELAIKSQIEQSGASNVAFYTPKNGSSDVIYSAFVYEKEHLEKIKAQIMGADNKIIEIEVYVTT